MSKISDLKFDDQNFNKHTEYGMSLLEKSLRQNGTGRSILIDKDNNIIAGNGIVEAAGSVGIENVKIVEITGDELVAVKRTDLSLDSDQGREMALADNAIYGIGEGKFERSDADESANSQYAIYARGKKGKFTNVRSLSNVWFFDKPRKSAEHPTMKPVGLCAKGVLAMSEPGDIVFDPFSGSGSTLIACEQTGRRCFGCELDPKYCDVIRKRWYKYTHGGDETGWEEGTPVYVG